MIRFTTFLNLFESSLSSSELIKSAGAGPNKGMPRYEVFAKKVWSKEEHILKDGTAAIVKKLEMSGVVYSASKKEDKVKFIKAFEETGGKGLKCIDPPLAMTNFAKTPEYGGKGGGEKISESTQELMTAAIVLNGYTYDAQDIDTEDAVDIIEAAKGEWGKIVGVKGKEALINQFTNNWYDLATAVSSANAILDITGAASKVFWTGQSWDKEIAEFNPEGGGVKNYNSSDIVVLGGDGIYHGFSLKKKKKSHDQDPTLINKPITGDKSLLKAIISASDLKKIEDAKVIFFNKLILDYHKKKKKLTTAKIAKLNTKERNNLIKVIPDDYVNDRLRGKGPTKNIFWQTADGIINKHKKSFCENFLKLIFRIDLQDMIDADRFQFYLLTGIGRKTGSGIGIEPAEVKDLQSTIEVLTKIFKKNALILGKTLDKQGKVITQPWEYDEIKGDPAAKVRYTIYNGKLPLINIEIRYKGSKTAEPQFQAVATPMFKNLFK